MAALTEITGNLLDPTLNLPAIGHGVNLRGVMGAGIAKAIRAAHPSVFEPYRHACRTGELTIGGYQAHVLDDGQVIYNLATQVRPGPDARLEAVESSVTAALEDCTRRGIDRLGLPQVGCGIGGLDWVEVRTVLAELAAQTEVTIVAVTFAPT